MTTTLTKWQRYTAKKPPEWEVWRSIKKRCYGTYHPYYHHYGGRGIKVCDRWMEHGQGFYNFIADMGARPSSDHQLDRIDPNKDYCPENCRWLHKFENNSRAHRKEEESEVVPF